jgi:hypothetical protein
MKYSPGGEVLWKVRHGHESWAETARALVLDDAGNVYVAGSAQSPTHPFSPGFLSIKYSSEGETLWVVRHEGTYCAHGRAIALSEQGNIYVAGSINVAYQRETKEDYGVVVYDPQGNEVWSAQFDGGLGLDDSLTAVAVDREGGVYLTGASRKSPDDFRMDMATVKYDVAGEEVWRARFGKPNRNAWAAALAVSSSGRVYVGGAAESSVTPCRLTILAYDAAGDLLWESRAAPPGGNDDRLQAVAVDGAGTIYAAGQTRGDSGVTEFTAVGFDPDGTRQWTARLGGPGSANALSLDSAGNVCVAGISDGAFTTAKYESEPPSVRFRRGDANADGAFNVADPVFLLLHLFRGERPPCCPKSADVDDSGTLSIGDAVLFLQYLFNGAGAPVEPFRNCGTDPSPDALSCPIFPPCEGM